MGRARAALELPGSAAEVEALWADPSRWPAFVDEFERVVSCDAGWPAVGTRLVWESHPGGRGRVAEKVLRHAPGVELVTELEDPQLRGVQRLAFAPAAGGGARATVGLALELDYALASRGPFMFLADPLFVRRALRDSLARTLAGLARELPGSVPARP